MLDLDSLAEKRALVLNEAEERWRGVVWGPDFSAVSRNMSDGEIELLLGHCQSVVHLERVLRLVLQHADAATKSPFAIMITEATGAGLDLPKWINSL